MIGNYILAAFVKGALKQSEALEKGGLIHAVWCNFQNNDAIKCNCGIADIQHALNLYIGQDDNDIPNK